MKNISEQIYLYRTKCGLSQLELAEKLDVSRQSISKWETGAAFPELPKLVKLCEIFGVSLDEFVSDEKPKEEIHTPEVQYIYVKPEPKSIIKPIIGAIFLVPALFMLLLLDLISGILFAIPCVISAIVCFRKTKHTALWCAWAWFFYADFMMITSTSIHWSYLYNASIWKHNSNIAIISLFAFLLLATLMIATVFAFRKYDFDFSAKKNIPLAVGVLTTPALYSLARFIWQKIAVEILTHEPIGDPTYVNGEPYYAYPKIPFIETLIIELTDAFIDTVFISLFTFCLVPTFYYLLHLIKKKKKLP